MARENKCQRPHTAGYCDPGGESLRLAMLRFGLSLSPVPVESAGRELASRGTSDGVVGFDL
jgi:hypothetical protein